MGATMAQEAEVPSSITDKERLAVLEERSRNLETRLEQHMEASSKRHDETMSAISSLKSAIDDSNQGGPPRKRSALPGLGEIAKLLGFVGAAAGTGAAAYFGSQQHPTPMGPPAPAGPPVVVPAPAPTAPEETP